MKLRPKTVRPSTLSLIAVSLIPISFAGVAQPIGYQQSNYIPETSFTLEVVQPTTPTENMPIFVSTIEEMTLDLAEQARLEEIEMEKAEAQKSADIYLESPSIAPRSSYLGVSMLSRCTYTAEELDRYLRFGLKGLGETYKKVERETGVNAMFLIAISALEGDHGRSPLAKDYNNIMGYGAFDGRVRENAIRYTSYEDCIRKVAQKIKEDYLVPSGEWYNEPHLEGINVKYCSDSTWSDEINQIMRDIDYFVKKGE